MASLPNRPAPTSGTPTTANVPTTSPLPEKKVSDEPSTTTQQPNGPSPLDSKPPVHVTPIPRIGAMAPISPVPPNRPVAPISPVAPNRPKLPPVVGDFLMGKTVNESGDVICAKTGQVLA